MTGKQIIDFESKTANPDIPNVYDVIPDEVLALKDKVHLIDVRRPEEYVGELGHVSEAKLITLDELPDHIADLPKNETIVFICRSGARSARATAFALENGCTSAYNMLGGMILWNEKGFEIEK